MALTEFDADPRRRTGRELARSGESGASGVPDIARRRPRPDASQELSTRLRGPSRFGAYVVGVFAFGFVLWAALTPLAGGAHAPGVVSTDGDRRTVKHFEGGVVRRILVREGDAVSAGDTLMILEDELSQADVDLLTFQEAALSARLARLGAERSGAAAIAFPPDARGDDPRRAELRVAQEILLETRRRSFEARTSVFERRAAEMRGEIDGLDGQIASAERQKALIGEEARGKEALAKRGLATRTQVLALHRAEAELDGRIADLRSRIARARDRIEQARLERDALEAERAAEIASETEKARRELNETREKLRARRELLRRTVIKAPIDGAVMDLRIKTVGGVVLRGEPILEIVPSGEERLIDARVEPSDIDLVRVGATAHVHFSAYSSRMAPRITGRVVALTADRVRDESGRRSYYRARVRVDDAELAKLAPWVELTPGMPADVVLVTGERTLLQYLIEPLTLAMSRSFL